MRRYNLNWKSIEDNNIEITGKRCHTTTRRIAENLNTVKINILRQRPGDCSELPNWYSHKMWISWSLLRSKRYIVWKSVPKLRLILVSPTSLSHINNTFFSRSTACLIKVFHFWCFSLETFILPNHSKKYSKMLKYNVYD